MSVLKLNSGEFIAFFGLLTIAILAVVILWSIRGVLLEQNALIIFSPVLPIKKKIPFDEIIGLRYKIDYNNKDKVEHKILAINYSENNQIKILKYALLNGFGLEKAFLERFPVYGYHTAVQVSGYELLNVLRELKYFSSRHFTKWFVVHLVTGLLFFWMGIWLYYEGTDASNLIFIAIGIFALYNSAKNIWLIRASNKFYTEVLNNKVAMLSKSPIC